MTIDIDKLEECLRSGPTVLGKDMTLELITQLREVEAREQALAARYAALADEVRAMIQDSDGLAGYHLNGEVACWSELEVGHLLSEPEDLGEKVLARRDADMLGDLAMRLDREGDAMLSTRSVEQQALGRKRRYAANVVANESMRLRRQADAAREGE